MPEMNTLLLEELIATVRNISSKLDSMIVTIDQLVSIVMQRDATQRSCICSGGLSEEQLRVLLEHCESSAQRSNCTAVSQEVASQCSLPDENESVLRTLGTYSPESQIDSDYQLENDLAMESIQAQVQISDTEERSSVPDTVSPAQVKQEVTVDGIGEGHLIHDTDTDRLTPVLSNSPAAQVEGEVVSNGVEEDPLELKDVLQGNNVDRRNQCDASATQVASLSEGQNTMAEEVPVHATEAFLFVPVKQEIDIEEDGPEMDVVLEFDASPIQVASLSLEEQNTIAKEVPVLATEATLLVPVKQEIDIEEDGPEWDVALEDSSHLSPITEDEEAASSSCEKSRGKELRRSSASVSNTVGKNVAKKHFSCSICTKVFKKPAFLKVHMRSHTGEQPYTCPECSKAFSVKGNLTKHMLLHRGDKSFHCDHCNASFFQKHHLVTHVWKHFGRRPFKCEECGKAFTHNSTLKTHKLLHSDIKPFCCDHCSAAFTTKQNLQKHEFIHSGQRPFQCEQCGKVFTQPSSLKTHMLQHSGVKDFHCDHCSASFTTKQNLQTHVFRHFGQKPFTCAQCGKGFTQKQALLVHIQTHTGDRPYKCDCGKAFSLKSTMKVHMKTHARN